MAFPLYFHDRSVSQPSETQTSGQLCLNFYSVGRFVALHMHSDGNYGANQDAVIVSIHHSGCIFDSPCYIFDAPWFNESPGKQNKVRLSLRRMVTGRTDVCLISWHLRYVLGDIRRQTSGKVLLEINIEHHHFASELRPRQSYLTTHTASSHSTRHSRIQRPFDGLGCPPFNVLALMSTANPRLSILVKRKSCSSWTRRYATTI